MERLARQQAALAGAAAGLSALGLEAVKLELG
jgi:hypothetical protein